MRNVVRGAIIAVVLSAIPSLVWADNASIIQSLADQKALLDAQAARDTAEAGAIKSGSDLAKAKAAAASTATTIQQSQYDAQAALTKSQVGAQTAQIDALKSTFGAPPAIGTDGNINITDAGTGMLLQIKAGSLNATWILAEKLCAALKAANVTDAYFAPSDLDKNIQSARMVLREFTALTANVRLRENREIVGLGGVTERILPAAAVLGAVSLVEYGAGALQAIAKLFKSDYAVGLSSDATRAAWLEYFMAATCPDQIPQAQFEAIVRNQSLDEVLAKLNEMLEFYNAAINKKNDTQKQIDLTTKRIAGLKAEDPAAAAFVAQLTSQNEVMRKIVSLDAWLPRIQTLITSVSTAPGAFLDAITWNAFGDGDNPLRISSKRRLTAVLTTQDGQVTKTHWLTGKKVYGRSAGELIYRVLEPNGKVVTVGYISAVSSTGEVQFGEKETAITVDSHSAPH